MRPIPSNKDLKKFFTTVKSSKDTFVWNGKNVPVHPKLPDNLKKIKEKNEK